MTKVQAIEQILRDNKGVATWSHIYSKIEHYYPAAKASLEWKAGIRGVLYREIKQGKRFKRIALGVFALNDHNEDEELAKIKESPVRMHSFVEGLLVEVGNHASFDTYCADPSVKFRPGVPIKELTTLSAIPSFTYSQHLKKICRIDVLFFSKSNFAFPKRAFEVVDSISTLSGALDRLSVLLEFQTELFIIAPQVHIEKIHERLLGSNYVQLKERVQVKNYEQITNYHESLLQLRMFQF